MIYEFSPKQDLHGYSKPWAPGANINLIPYPYTDDAGTYKGVAVQVGPDGKITASGESTEAVSFYLASVELDDGTYTFSFSGKLTGWPFRIYDSTASENAVVLNSPGNGSFTAVAGHSYNIYLHRGSAGSVDVEGYGQLEAGSTATPFSPYSNICPLEGYNIWDPDNAEMIPVYSGYVDANANKLYLHPWYTEYDGEELVGPWMSSMDEYTEEGTPTTGAFVVDMGGELIEVDITDFMLQTLLDSLGVRRFITSGAMLLNSLMDQAQGRVRSEAELLNRSLPIHVIAIGDELPVNLIIKKSDVLPGLPGKIKI